MKTDGAVYAKVKERAARQAATAHAQWDRGLPLTAIQTATVLGVSKMIVDQLDASGQLHRIPANVIGPKLRKYTRAEIERFLADATPEPVAS